MPDWICYLGGDIIYQSRVVDFNKEFKKHGKKICIYTGKQFEEINEETLDSIDLLKCGEWRQELGPITQDGTNQEFWLFIRNFTKRASFRKRIFESCIILIFKLSGD